MANMPTPIELDAPRRVPGLLDAARPLPAGWERGVAFNGTQCVEPFVVGQCPEEEDLKPPQEPSLSSWTPVQVGTVLQCITPGMPNLARLADGAQDGSLDYALARELATGEASVRDGGANESLTTATALDNLGEQSSVTEALSCLEAAIATSIFGRLGTIHMSPSVAVHALAERAIWRDGARWRTPWGTGIIISAGYEGITQATLTGPIWATGEVYAAVGSRDPFDDIDRAANLASAYTEQVALAVFDLCFVAVAGTGVECEVPV